MGKTNKMNEKYEYLKKELKKRGVALSKDMFFDDISERFPEEIIQKMLESYSPKEFLINERMQKDPEFKEKIVQMMNI